MAAPSNTVWGSVSGQGKLGIAVSASSTNTQTTLTVDVWLAVRYNIDDSNNSYSFSYTNDSGNTSTSNDSDISLDFGTTSGEGWADVSQKKIKTHTLTYTRGTSSKKINLSAKFNDLGSEDYDVSVSTSYTVPALTSYTITYNANGGSGAPSSQTKYYGQTLKLSSTKPTKNGYTFAGWGTSASDTTVDYASGANYTANASDELFAIWKKTITLSYNANGGSGAPSSQSATVYNATTHYTFTISSTKPTRTGYTFLGWNIVNTATTASFSSGDVCSMSASDTLYAVWSENKLTVNYYSNYATYAAFKGVEVNANESTNILVYSQDFYYDNAVSSGLADIRNVDYVYISKTGYDSTGYWGTSTDGGTLINQSTTYSTGQALAQALGKNLSNGNVSINLYPQWKAIDYKIDYNANGGIGNMNSQIVHWKDTFALYNNVFKREGYKFIGWNVYREDDDTWYVIGQGWLTEDDIIINGYEKKLYENQSELIFDNSWIKGIEDGNLQYVMNAIWEISGVVYIDNGSTFKPYLTYIDNGTDWDLYLAYVDDGTDWNIIS